MKKYKEYFLEELEKVNDLINVNNSNIAKLNGTPEGFIFITKKRNGYQYSYKGINDIKAKYLKVSEKEVARKVAQMDYEKKVKRYLKRKQYALTTAIKCLEYGEITEVYEKLGEGRKMLINPLVPTNEEYINEWYLRYPGNMNSHPYNIGYETERGEQVRSKSEKIIADMLNKYEIPYSYETQLKLGTNVVVYPDFVALNVKTRKTLAWEHLGLIDKEDYAVKNLGKLAYYEQSGYIVGQNLIITMESENIPLNIKIVEKKIREFLL